MSATRRLQQGTALDSASVAITITDLDLGDPGLSIRNVNSAFEEMTGYGAEEVLGRSADG